MEEDVLKLSEVVVTGLASTVARKNLANAVGTVTAGDLVPAPAQTLERALSGKFAGISVNQNTGAPGGGISVNLRGTSTIVGGNQPLYVIDGVIIDNSATQSGIDLVTEAAAAGSSNPQGQPTNRIADINPNDIERVEVLKGASAAAVYGAKASNGVIIISTKSGRLGKPKINISQRIGFSQILRKIGTRKFTAETAEEAFGEEGRDEFLANGGQFVDHEDVLYGETGILNETTASISGGSERTQFFLSGLAQDEAGIVENTGYGKFSGRFNINHQFNDRFSIKVATSALRSESTRGITGNDNSFTTFGFALAFTPSYVDLRQKSDGSYPNGLFSNPVQTRDLLENEETVWRIMNSARADLNLFKSARNKLDFVLQAGFDFYSQFNNVFSPPTLQFEKNSDQPGRAINGESRNVSTNIYLSLIDVYTTASNIRFTTSAGFQLENRQLDNSVIFASDLIAGQSNVDQGASSTIMQNIIKQFDRGFYAQEEINIRDKYYLTAGLRGDASSSHGDVKKYFLYPKFSGSVRLSEFDFWRGLSSFSNEFKLRTAYGETGKSPVPFSKFTSFISGTIGGKIGLIGARRRGNPDIQPERTKEVEFGFDASFWNSNAALEFTYYRQNISDLILLAELPFSSGFEQEFRNAGKMRTDGFEIGLNLWPVKNENFSWNAHTTFYRTRSVITELEVDPFNIGGFATSLGTYRIEKDKSPTTLIGTFGDEVEEYGDGEPDFEMAFNNQFEMGQFSFRFLWHWKKGGLAVNLGKFISDLGKTTFDYDEVKKPVFDEENENEIIGYTTSRLDSGRTKVWVEDAGYVKLREASLSYQFKKSTIERMFGQLISSLKVGVAGRNLLMITDYTGYDPEVSQFGNVAVGRGIDTIPFPSTRSFYFTLDFGF